MTGTLILPCETRVREFDAKLLLGCHAAERGWRVIVGYKRSIDMSAPRLPRGIYVGKSLTNRNLFLYRIMQRLGHRLVAWDEEGLVYASPALYYRTKIGAETLNAPDCLFAWGEANAEAWRRHPQYGGPPIGVTGNPRADLLRPELRGFFADQVRSLNNEHGDFVLINTNFSRLNHYFSHQNRQRRLLRDGGEAITDEADPRLGLAGHKAALLEHFKQMLPALARACPEHRIVLRPHPSENQALWHSLARGLDNVRVIHEGNIAAWLQAARVTVHNGCTTAVESFLLDRPALAFQPVTSGEFDHDLPNGLSVQAFSLDNLCDRVRTILAGDESALAQARHERRGFARRHVASIDGDPACTRILDALEEPGFKSPRSTGGARRLGASAAARIRALGRGVGALVPLTKQHVSYRHHMFPPVTRKEVERSVARFGTLLGAFDRIRVEDWSESAFVLTVP